jgi:hypothetical protein
MLRRNRRILQQLLPEKEDSKKVSREQLLQLGFHFKHFTHSYTNKKGSTYFYCYEYGYLPLEKDYYLLVKRKNS